MTKRTTSPFRYDIVGSYLRPIELKQAKIAFEAEDLTKEELKKVEDKAIIDLIKKQEELGLKAVTDGEFRRSWWHLDFFWGLQGVKFKAPAYGYKFHHEETRPGTVTLTGKITGEKHPFLEDFKFVKEHVAEGTEVKQTIPAPAQILGELFRPDNMEDVRKIYATDEELLTDLVKAYKQVILDFYDAGLRTLQLDDCTWGILVAPFPDGFISPEDTRSDQEIRDSLKELYLSVNNAVIEGLPDDLTVNTHVCRGNYHSTWAFSGPYDGVADPLFTKEKVNAYYLEYDSDRSGGFEPLQQVQKDQLVVLGLVTSKDGELEDRQQIIDRIKEASKYIDLDRLALSPQCGFASTEEGNILTEEQQWEKIRFIKSIAEEIWQDA
ncbi:5-methyltetrahydropteroyltriglutamate--homocysteine S-methyltransferase [Enterococcus olivae]